MQAICDELYCWTSYTKMFVMNEPEEELERQRMGGVMQAFAWVALLALGVLFFGDVLDKHYNPNETPRSTRGASGAREVTLQRNKYGHYVTSGTIDEQPVVFMLDTGATGVAIPDAVAQRLGLKRGRRFATQTANGTGVSYAVTLGSVAVGDIELNDVQAGITPGLQGEEILLGMSFLKHIEFTQRGDTLILRQ